MTSYIYNSDRNGKKATENETKLSGRSWGQDPYIFGLLEFEEGRREVGDPLKDVVFSSAYRQKQKKKREEGKKRYKA